MVLVPLYYGAPEKTQAFACIQALPLRHPVGWLGGPGLSSVRDSGLEAFLRSDADVALFVDSDVTFEVDAPKAVIARARETQGVAGAAFPSSLASAGMNVWPEGSFAGTDTYELPLRIGLPTSEIHRVDGLGCGLLAIHRAVCDRILFKFPWLALSDPRRRATWFRQALFERFCAGNLELSEDLSFCWRAKQAGCTVELVEAAAVGHRDVPPTPGHYACKMQGLGLLDLLEYPKHRQHDLTF